MTENVRKRRDLKRWEEEGAQQREREKEVESERRSTNRQIRSRRLSVIDRREQEDKS